MIVSLRYPVCVDRYAVREASPQPFDDIEKMGLIRDYQLKGARQHAELRRKTQRLTLNAVKIN
jgi:hypothetical protein